MLNIFWPLLSELQLLVIGQSRIAWGAYVNMDVDDSLPYDKVKAAIL